MMDKYYDDGYSGTNNMQSSYRRYGNRRGSSRSRGYSRDNDMMSRLDDMYQNARNDQEANMIHDIMNELIR